LDLLADGQIVRIIVEMISLAVNVSNLHSYTDLGNTLPLLCVLFFGRLCLCPSRVRVSAFSSWDASFVDETVFLLYTTHNKTVN